jgi:chemotaxis protein methyltransferase WspC
VSARAALIELLHQRLGLDASVLGDRVLDDAFGEARRALGLSGDAALYSRAAADPAGFAEVIEHFVVPETWFFRAPEQYCDLVRYARARGTARAPLRVLSLPCATGEEAYSAAMTLLDAGFAPEQFEVLGIDVSKRLVDFARAGVYRRNAVRGDPASSPWVVPRGEAFEIDPLVRRTVRFRVGNALDAGVFQPDERFDVVFCRNLLIYLHDAARTRLLALLSAALAPPALVLAGQAEVLPVMAAGFAPFEGASPLSYVFDPDHAIKLAPPASAQPPPSPEAEIERRMPKRRPEPARAAPTPPPPAAAPPLDLDATRALADQGQLDAARERCVEHLKLRGDDVDAWYLLGLVESARGDAAAADAAFARVLYLDGEHAEALEHRIALAERLGDREHGKRLRERARRLARRRRGEP